MDFALHPNAAGIAFAAIAVAAGGRLFGTGLRAFRVTRGMSGLTERPLSDAPCGLVHTRGKVVLDSPLFAPLSGRPCAGFRLDVHGSGTRAGASIEERRVFRITGGEVSARVLAGAGRWRMSETGRREARPGERISESVDALLDSRAEVAMLRRRGVGLVLTEHALLAGGECHVVGWSRRPRPYEMPVALEVARTGTDDDTEVTDAAPAPRAPSRGWFAPERRQPGRPFPHDVDLWVDGGSHDDGPLVSDTAPRRADLVMSRWDAAALVIGPVLCLCGLLFLAHAAEQLRDRARFYGECVDHDWKSYAMATVALVSGPLLFLKGFRTVRMRRLIANTPTARIRSLAMGLVEVQGTIEPRSVLSAPFSGKPCAFWQVDIATRNRSGWTVIHRNQSGHPFFVRDDTGVAMVYPHGAQGKLAVRGEESCLGLTLPPCYADYMNAHGSAFNQLSRMGQLRFREYLLEAGDAVYVLGTAMPRSSSRVIAGEEVLQQAVNEDPGMTRLRELDRGASAVIRRGENEPTFIISQESESSLMLGLGGRALLEVVAGPALTLFGLAHWMLALSAGLRP